MANITQTITQFPPAPDSVNDTPPEFNQKANAFVGHQSGVYVGEVNQWATEANALRDEVNSISANLPDGVINDATPSSTDTFSSDKIVSMMHGYKNLIINGGFDVWQRGTSFNTNAGYTADRWYIGGSTNTYPVSMYLDPQNEEYTFKIDGFAAGTPTPYLTQPVGLGYKGRNDFYNDDLTFSFYFRSSGTAKPYVDCMFRDGIGGSSTTVPVDIVEQPSPSTTLQRYVFTFRTKGMSIDSDANCLLPYIRFGDGDASFSIVSRVQLERGTTVTPFEHRPKGAELSLCQRYYEEGDANVIISGYHTSYVRVNTVSYMVEKRKTPSVTSVLSSVSGHSGTQGALYNSNSTTTSIAPTFSWTGMTAGTSFIGKLTYTIDAEI